MNLFSSLPIAAFGGALALMALSGLAQSPQAQITPSAGKTNAPVVVRFGTTGRYLADVKPEDALAAYKAYAAAMARRRGLDVSIEGYLYHNLQSLREALLANELEVVGLVIPDYFALEKDGTLDLMFSGEVNGRVATEYLLLVRRDAKATDLRDLKKGRLVELVGAKTGLARIWLDVVLAEKGLPFADEFFGSIREEATPTRAVLPVFFRQVEGCLVTRQSFETMVELNPQVGQTLRVVASSPSVVSYVTCFRRGFAGRYRDETISAYLETHLHPEGKQALTMFKMDRIVRCELKDLEAARRLVAQHDALKEKKRTEGNPVSRDNPGKAEH